ncbi:MAG: hypothetical protein KDD84_20685 [Caldilineaceae bacterium]|nr:hypothetical protein [Caldilineaceae bacterium]
MRVVVLTNHGSLFGKKMLNEFRARQIDVTAAVVIKQPLSYHWKLFNYVQKRVGYVDALLFAIERLTAHEDVPTSWGGGPFVSSYEEMGIPIHYTDQTNSPQTVETLRTLAPDLLILGQTGIIRKRVIQIPKVGTLNAHPAILPYYRGIDCERWAIFNRDFDKIGSSVHWVDVGVDTGSIIQTKRHVLTPGETLHSLETNLENLSVGLMADVVASLSGGEEIEAIAQNSEQGQQFYKMPRKYERVVKNILSNSAYAPI